MTERGNARRVWSGSRGIVHVVAVPEPHEVGTLGVVLLKQDDKAQAVRAVGVPHEVRRRVLGIACADAGEVRDGAEATGPDQVTENVLSRVVDVVVDRVCRERPGSRCELDPDVPAYLS